MLSRFYLIPERYGQTVGQTDGQTDRRTELLYQYRASTCWRAIKMLAGQRNKEIHSKVNTKPCHHMAGKHAVNDIPVHTPCGG